MQRFQTHLVAICSLVLLLAPLFGLLQPTPALAQSFNQQINYQGKLADNLGATVADGSYSMQFRLYTVASGGSNIWSETQSVTVENGLFSVMLGTSTSLSGINFNQTLYLGVNIQADGEMTPRKILGAVPAAFEAGNSETLGGVASTSFLRNDIPNAASALLSFTGGFVSSASSTISELTTGTTTVTTLMIDGEEFTSLSGGASGLTNNAGTLTANISESNLNITGTPTNDYVLQASSTAAGGFVWAATSTLGIDGGASDFLSLTDTPGSYTANRLFFANSGGTAVTDSANLTFDELNLDLGSTAGIAFGGTRFFYASTSILSVAIGDYAGANNTGSDNNIFGGYAGFNNSGGSNNIFGGYAGESNTGSNNNFLGYEAGRYNKGNFNNSIGYQAGFNNANSYTEMIGFETGSRMSASNTVAIGGLALRGGAGSIFDGTNATTTNNTVIGYGAGYNVLTGGDNNLLLGYQAADSLTTGANNIIIGYDVEAPSNTADGQLNIGNLLFGTGIDGTGTSLSSGNIGIGTSSPSSKLTVAGDVYITGALRDSSNSAGTNGYVLQTTGSGTQWVATSTLGLGGGASDFLSLTDTPGSYTANRLFFANSGGTAVTDSANLTFDGVNLNLGGTNTGLAFQGTRMFYASTTNDSIAIGEFAGETFTNNTQENIAIGYGAGRYASTTGADFNTYIGLLAGSANTGNDNILIGYTTGMNNTGQYVSAIGESAAENNTGSYVQALGQNAGFNNSGDTSSLIGTSAGYENTGDYVAAVGYNAGFSNDGTQNSFFGTSAGYGNQGTENTFLGWSAGASNSGNNNFAVGTDAGRFNSGSSNNFMGTSAGDNNEGSYNTFIGEVAGRNNIGNFNDFIGYRAGQNLESTSTVAIGGEALRGVSGIYQAVNNVAIGYHAGYNAQTGASNNLLLGYQAADSLTTGANNIIIGYDVEAPSNTGDNQLNIGNLLFGTGIDGTGTTLSSGNIGIGTSTPNAKLAIAQSADNEGIIVNGFDDEATSYIGLTINELGYADVNSNTILEFNVSGTDRQLRITNLGSEFNFNNNSAQDFRVNGTSANLIFADAGTNRVGIGTSSPASKLDVWGDFRVGTSSAPLLFVDTAKDIIFIGTTTKAFSSTQSANIYNQINEFSSFNVQRGLFNEMFVDGANELYVLGVENRIDTTNTANSSEFYGTNNNIYIADGNAWGTLNDLQAKDDAESAILYGTDTRLLTHTGDIGYGLLVTDTFTSTGGTQYGVYLDIDDVDLDEAYSVYVNAGSADSYFGSNVGIGTSSPSSKLTVAGDVYITGALRDSSNSAGTTGYVLQTTGSGTQWVATSTLGIGGGGASDFLSLTDTPGSYTANRLFFANSGGTAVTDSANLTFDGVNLNLGGTNTGLAFQGTRMFYASTTNDSIAIGEGAGENFNSNTTQNIAIGYQAGQYASTTGVDYATYLGYQAGQNDNYGEGNMFLGYQAGKNASNVEYTSAVGYLAGENSSSKFSSFYGNYAGQNSSGNNNNFFGESAGIGNSGSENLLVGLNSGANNSGNYNSFIGSSAGRENAGNYNEMIGFATGRYLSATNTVAIGSQALYGASGLTNLVNNTVLGYGAGYGARTGADNNILIGYQAADSLTTGANNIIIGYDVEAPSNTADGQLNIGNLLFGTRIDGAGTTLSSGNIGIGTSSPSSKLDVWGDFSLKSNLFASVGPSGDSFFIAGATSTSVLSGATNNLAFGSDSQFSLTTGDNNISFGNGTLYSNTLGNENIAIGLSAINSNSGNGSNNIALGTSALENNGSGNENIAFGSRALFTNDSGGNSIAIGTEALYQNSGSSTIAIGYRAGDNAVSVDRSIIIGYDVDFASNTADDQLNIGNLIFGTGIDGTGTTLSSGNIGIGVTDPSAKLDVVSNVADTYAAELVNTSVDGFGAYVYVGNNDADKSALTLENSDGIFFSALNNGNIGIGTSSPASKLDVWGDFRVGTSSTPTFTVNPATGFVGIGAAPSGIYDELLGIQRNQNSPTVSYITNDSSGSAAGSGYLTQADVGSGGFITYSSNYFIADLANTTAMQATGGDIALLTDGGDIRFVTSVDEEKMRITDAGNVGIGTSTPSSKLSIANTSFSGAGIIGLDQYLTTANSVAAALQYGSRTYISNNSNTATTSLVGNAINVADNTTFGNTVRGLEVQADLGSNTQGENTALSGFARTFGVRGFTSADAGGSFEPAGGFFETGGTTQGNAIRGYSSSITSASLLSLFQDTSDFTGTGLEMNFGNTTGDFASTSSKYLDFQNAGTSIFTVSAFGTTTIGANDGTTVNMAGLQIGYGGLCVDNDGECTASTTGTISAVDYLTGNSDLAENYFSATNLAPGELVTLAGGLSVDRADADSELPILGVVSTKPGLTLGSDDTSLNAGETAYPIALSGRVPVQLSTENGPIEKGDRLMLSSLPGIAMKATGTGMTIGIALEDFDDSRMYSDTYLNQFADDMVDPVYEPVVDNTDPRINDGCYYGGGSAAGDAPCVPLVSTTTAGQIAEVNDRLETESVAAQIADLRRERSNRATLEDGATVRVGQVVMFVENQYKWVADDQLAMLGLLGSAELLEEADEDETFFDRLVALANSFVDGVFSIFELRADRVEVADELCVDGVCINADDLRRLLEQPADSGTSGTPSPTTPVPADDGEPADDGVTPTESEPVIEDTEEGTSATTTSTSTYIGTDDSGTVPDDSSVASSSDTGSETDSEPPSTDSEEAPPDDQTTTPEPPQADAEPEPEEVIELEEEGEESSAEIEVSTDEQEAVNSEII